MKPLDIRICETIGAIDAAAWDRLAGPQPFVRHAFLHALEVTECVSVRTGWQPCHLTLWDGDELAAACPLYAKSHSYGEYVFDWAWAQAYAQHGLEYYPKLVCAVPFSPIPGGRLLARDEAARGALAHALEDFAQRSGVSSLHILFSQVIDLSSLFKTTLLPRQAVQFHWQNQGWHDFEEFLAALTRERRKKIRQERRRVAEAGVTFRSVAGTAISEADWAFFHRCYTNTYHERGQHPYLNLAFFKQLAASMPDNLLLFVAEREGRPIAAVLNLRDAQALYGRYWGAVEHVPLLHFEACYYQGIEWCITHGVARFEGGAQGEHKLARGLTPVRTHSLHWLRDARFADAVARHLAREGENVAHYVDELDERTPFRTPVGIGGA